MEDTMKKLMFLSSALLTSICVGTRITADPTKADLNTAERLLDTAIRNREDFYLSALNAARPDADYSDYISSGKYHFMNAATYLFDSYLSKHPEEKAKWNALLDMENKRREAYSDLYRALNGSRRSQR